VSRRWLDFALGVLALAAMPTLSRAQVSTLIGTVRRDSVGSELAGADVKLSGLVPHVLTDARGVFRVNGLPAGRYAITIRHLGFRTWHDTIDIDAGKRIERDFVMIAQPPELDSVRVVAQGKKWLSPNLQAFEERRLSGQGGHFITDSLLRRNDDRRMGGFIAAYMPGIALVNKSGNEYLASTRKCGSGGQLLTCGSGFTCWVTVYLDGVRIYDATMETYGRGAGASIRPDFGRMTARDYAAVEFYAGGATIPAQYNATGSDCGVLLLWTRER
jgi:hypothetical protein